MVATKKNASIIARQRPARPSATASTVSSGSSVNDTYAPELTSLRDRRPDVSPTPTARSITLPSQRVSS
jgi:hypothetical protein